LPRKFPSTYSEQHYWGVLSNHPVNCDNRIKGYLCVINLIIKI
jgi:hypothetical protein